MIIRKLKCPYCDKVLSRYSVWKFHIEGHLKGECPVCKGKIKNPSMHLLHMYRYEEKQRQRGITPKHDHSELFFLFAKYKTRRVIDKDRKIAVRCEVKAKMVDKYALPC